MTTSRYTLGPSRTRSFRLNTHESQETLQVAFMKLGLLSHSPLAAHDAQLSSLSLHHDGTFRRFSIAGVSEAECSEYPMNAPSLDRPFANFGCSTATRSLTARADDAGGSPSARPKTSSQMPPATRSNPRDIGSSCVTCVPMWVGVEKMFWSAFLLATWPFIRARRSVTSILPSIQRPCRFRSHHPHPRSAPRSRACPAVAPSGDRLAPSCVWRLPR